MPRKRSRDSSGDESDIFLGISFDSGANSSGGSDTFDVNISDTDSQQVGDDSSSEELSESDIVDAQLCDSKSPVVRRDSSEGSDTDDAETSDSNSRGKVADSSQESDTADIEISDAHRQQEGADTSGESDRADVRVNNEYSNHVFPEIKVCNDIDPVLIDIISSDCEESLPTYDVTCSEKESEQSISASEKDEEMSEFSTGSPTFGTSQTSVEGDIETFCNWNPYEGLTSQLLHGEPQSESDNSLHSEVSSSQRRLPHSQCCEVRETSNISASEQDNSLLLNVTGVSECNLPEGEKPTCLPASALNTNFPIVTSNLPAEERSEYFDQDLISSLSSLSSIKSHSELDLDETYEGNEFGASVGSGSSSSLVDLYCSDDPEIKTNFITNNTQERSKVHSSTDISIEEGILKVVDAYLKNKCSKNCLQDFLTAIIDLLPNNHRMPKTLFHLFQFINKLAPQPPAIHHYYCSSCLVYFGTDQQLECPTCHCVGNSGIFYEFDIASQVKFLLEHRNLAQSLENESPKNPSNVSVVRDITDGLVYKQINCNRKMYDLTFILNCDGLKLRKSSSSDVWLLMMKPAEVPTHLRENFITIIGVWCDSNQPNMNTFLKPFCMKFRQIFQNNGVVWKHPVSGVTQTSQITAPLFIADAPARAKVQNISNHNGKYGCNICEVKTVRAARIPGKRTLRVYARNFDARPRDGGRMLAQGVRAAQSRSIIKGVKGPSVISILVYVDLATFLIPEYMHAVLLGVVRQLMNIWFEKPGQWSLKDRKREINNFFNSVRPPDFFQRKPRDTSLLKLWKASEFYYWLLYYSIPALKPFLPQVYFEHYLLLVRSIFTLIQSSIKESEIEESENVLRLFVQDMETIYGERAMTYNVHQLLHLGLVVRRWVPLHLISAFCFENINGIVAKETHGTKSLGQEIVNNVKIAQGVQVLRGKVKQCRDAVLPCESNFKCKEKVSPPLSEEERALMLSSEIPASFVSYAKAQIRQSVFTSSLYKRLRTCDYIVSWLDSNCKYEYGSIRFFIEHDRTLFVFIDKLSINHSNVWYHTQTRKAVTHILPFKTTKDCIVLKVDEPLCLRKEICIGNYICKRPNDFHEVV